MAKGNFTSPEGNSPEIVPFMTGHDEGNLIREDGASPIMMIHPDATSLELWSVAQSRIEGLHKLLSMMACTGETEMCFDIADMAAVILPRVEEIKILADEANNRAHKAKKAKVTKLATIASVSASKV